jgi:hypothetical protein
MTSDICLKRETYDLIMKCLDWAENRTKKRLEKELKEYEEAGIEQIYFYPSGPVFEEPLKRRIEHILNAKTELKKIPIC